MFKKLYEKYDGKHWKLEYTNEIQASKNNLMIVLTRKWNQCSRNIHIFSKNNSAWLDIVFNLRIIYQQVLRKNKQVDHRKYFRNVLKETESATPCEVLFFARISFGIINQISSREKEVLHYF